MASLGMRFARVGSSCTSPVYLTKYQLISKALDAARGERDLVLLPETRHARHRVARAPWRICMRRHR